MAATYDGSVGRVYVDGRLVGSNTLGTMSQGPNFHVGELLDYPHFDGRIDEVRLSSGLRYTGEFAPPTTAFTPDASTLALFHLDEDGGQVARDASGGGHDLVLGASGATELSDPSWVRSTAPLLAAGTSASATSTPASTATPPSTPTATPTPTSTPTVMATVITPTATTTPTGTRTAVRRGSRYAA